MSAGRYDLFAYGSLQLSRIMQVATGRLFECEPALLRGYARYALRGETYPGIVEDVGNSTDGVLWRDLDDATLTCLDTFEGSWYRRDEVTVIVGDESIPAVTYVLVSEQQHRVSRRRWSLKRFETRCLQRFLRDNAAHL
ncbi:MAG: gamma-glutamylcyclotransferase family protein [Candidatus Latescibacterota bacterium]|nr:gamma-glutamylcyclotransferase family protein [Candidatus Latescibacterota bacterium]